MDHNQRQGCKGERIKTWRGINQWIAADHRDYCNHKKVNTVWHEKQENQSVAPYGVSQHVAQRNRENSPKRVCIRETRAQSQKNTQNHPEPFRRLLLVELAMPWQMEKLDHIAEMCTSLIK